MDNFFNRFPEFVQRDNRKDREQARVTAESLAVRCEAFLPDVRGKTILDLGCCIGAMGHWCLSHGATHYTGVEVQEEYAKIAEELLTQHHPSESVVITFCDIRRWLEENKNFYDIVICLGVIYVFVNTFDMVEKICKICREEVIIDSLYPVFDYNDHSVIEIIKNQRINNSLDINMGLNGVGVRPSESALKLIFSLYGFSENEKVIPKSVMGAEHDSYNDYLITPYKTLTPARFGYRFFKNSNPPDLYDLQTVVVSQRDQTKQLNPIRYIKSWEFDENVAKRFKQEALNNIPDYVKVVNKIGPTIRQHFKNADEVLILDVGSAIGYTIDRLLIEGFLNVYGVENSYEMIKHSMHKERVYYGDKLPLDKKWDVIVINWTLHFIKWREAYLKSAHEGLKPGGLLFLTDKMDGNEDDKKKYREFKIERGMTEEEIDLKAASLEGVLITKPIHWYFNLLKDIGFTGFVTINERFMFKTIIARKL